MQFNATNFHGTIELPSSKSLTNRALMIATLCEEAFTIHSPSNASDSLLLAYLLNDIQIDKEIKTLHLNDAGTPFRLLTAYLAAFEHTNYVLTGHQRMLERPIADLVDALLSLGADIQYTQKVGYPPIHIQGRKLIGKDVQLNANVSSQFASALCLIAPTLEQGLSIHLQKQHVSNTYLKMTLGMMRYFGIESSYQQSIISIPPQHYKPNDIHIEKDWSGATFFYCMAFMMEEVDLTLLGLNKDSLQGDSFIRQIGDDLGIETHFDAHGAYLKRKSPIDLTFHATYQLTDYPDLAVPLIVLCALQYPHIQLTGLHHLELKESKRISVLCDALAKINVHIHYANDIMSFNAFLPSPTKESIHFESHADHRIVMALSLITLKGYVIEFDEINCLQKSFPDFMEQFSKISQSIS